MPRATGRYERTAIAGETVAAFVPNLLPPKGPALSLDGATQDLLASAAEYYRLLNAVRLEGAWEAWVTFFLEGVSTTADEASSTARDLFVLVNKDRARVLDARNSSVTAARLLELLPRRPIVTIPTIVKMLKTTKPTAAKAVSVLERLGILKETTGRRRDRAYAYDAYLERLRAGTELVER